MADLAELPPDSWARIELAKLSASEKLKQDLAQARAEKLRRHLTPKIAQGTDDEQLFQDELGFAYADYVKEVVFAEVEERRKTGLDRAKLPAVLDKILRARVLSILEMWAASGGAAEYRDLFIDTAYKVVKVSRQYKQLLEQTAEAQPPSGAEPERPAQKQSEALAKLGLEEPANNANTEKSAARCSVVMPILNRLKWTRSKWAAKAGVGKNSAYEYLDGSRNLSEENRRAMAEVLSLKPEQLPD